MLLLLLPTHSDDRLAGPRGPSASFRQPLTAGEGVGVGPVPTTVPYATTQSGRDGSGRMGGERNEGHTTREQQDFQCQPGATCFVCVGANCGAAGSSSDSSPALSQYNSECSTRIRDTPQMLQWVTGVTADPRRRSYGARNGQPLEFCQSWGRGWGRSGTESGVQGLLGLGPDPPTTTHPPTQPLLCGPQNEGIGQEGRWTFFS